MQTDAIEIAQEAIGSFMMEKDMANFIKKEFDKKYNPTWHVIIGKSWGAFVTHATKYDIPCDPRCCRLRSTQKAREAPDGAPDTDARHMTYHAFIPPQKFHLLLFGRHRNPDFQVRMMRLAMKALDPPAASPHKQAGPPTAAEMSKPPAAGWHSF